MQSARRFVLMLNKSTKPDFVPRFCPKCTKDAFSADGVAFKAPVFLVKRTNKKYGVGFMGCQNYPNCKYSESLSQRIENTLSPLLAYE